MGRMHAEEFAGMVERDEIKLDAALTWHLQGNHYPPVSTAFIPIAKEAIEIAKGAVNLFEDGFEEEAREDLETVLTLPNGKKLTVEKIVEGLHLESWVTIE